MDQYFDVDYHNDCLEDEDAINKQTSVYWFHALVIISMHGCKGVAGLSIHGVECDRGQQNTLDYCYDV